MKYIDSFLGGILSVISFSACTIDAGMKATSLHAENVISKLGDSIFLSKQISCIDSRKDTIYISDYHAGVYSLDRNLKLIKKVSSIGLGQGEVNRPAKLFMSDNGIALFNEGTQKYSYFSGTSFLKNDSKAISNNLACASRFFTKGDSVYQSIINDQKLVAITRDGITIKKICPIVKGIDDADNPALSERHLVKGSKSFYIIGRGLPIIQEYSFEGSELARFDLSSIPLLTNAYEKSKKNKVPNSYYVIVNDAYYKNDKIFLLTSLYEDDYKCNTLIVLKALDGCLQYLTSYNLQKDVYSTFCINDKNECYAVCSMNGTIEVYQLPI